MGFAFAAAVSVLLAADKSGACAASLAASFLHESGHLLCLVCMKDPPESVELFACGIRITQKNNQPDLWREIAVAASGPAMNFIAGLFLLFIHRPDSDDIRFAAVNLLIGAFNMLPCVPLDACRILTAVLGRFYDGKTVERVTLGVSTAVAATVSMSGAAVLAVSGGNFSLLSVGIYLLLSAGISKKRLPKQSD